VVALSSSAKDLFLLNRVSTPSAPPSGLTATDVCMDTSNHSGGSRSGPGELETALHAQRALPGPVPLPCLFITIPPGAPKINRSAMAKRSEALYRNVDWMIKRNTLERIVFMTLTFPGRVTSYRTANKRFNSFATHFLRLHLIEWVKVPERMKSGSIHFHLIGAFPVDVRTGFDFASCGLAKKAWADGDRVLHKNLTAAYSRSANDALRGWWALVREKAPLYGFGRCETLPVISNGEAASRYIGGYVSAEVEARRPEDKGMRMVAYSLLEKPASIRFSWIDGPAARWRLGLGILGVLLGLTLADFPIKFGPRWAWRVRDYVNCFVEHEDRALTFVRQIPEWADLASRLRFACALYSYLSGKAANPFAFQGLDTCHEPF